MQLVKLAEIHVCRLFQCTVFFVITSFPEAVGIYLPAMDSADRGDAHKVAQMAHAPPGSRLVPGDSCAIRKSSDVCGFRPEHCTCAMLLGPSDACSVETSVASYEPLQMRDVCGLRPDA